MELPALELRHDEFPWAFAAYGTLLGNNCQPEMRLWCGFVLADTVDHAERSVSRAFKKRWKFATDIHVLVDPFPKERSACVLMGDRE